MRKGKFVPVSIGILLAISLTGGILGFLENKKQINQIETPEDYTVTYKYFVDGEEQKNKVVQKEVDYEEEFEGTTTKTEVYKFIEAKCTNNVSGAWDNKKWEYTPKLTANTTCKLYFEKQVHDIEITATNAKLPNNETTYNVQVKNETEKKISVIPTEGYTYEEIKCDDGITAKYDEELKDITITSATKDGKCKISFKIDDFEVKVKVSNGTIGEDTKTLNYGESAEFTVTPSENYKFETVTCTNDQKATYEGTTLKVIGISKDTVCTIQFKPIKYTVSLTVENGKILESKPSPQTIQEGGTVSFGISGNEGYTLTGATSTCDKEANIVVQSGTVTISNVKSDLNCKVTLKAKSE